MTGIGKSIISLKILEQNFITTIYTNTSSWIHLFKSEQFFDKMFSKYIFGIAVWKCDILWIWYKNYEKLKKNINIKTWKSIHIMYKNKIFIHELNQFIFWKLLFNYLILISSHNYSNPFGIKLRSSCTSHHLKNGTLFIFLIE